MAGDYSEYIHLPPQKPGKTIRKLGKCRRKEKGNR